MLGGGYALYVYIDSFKHFVIFLLQDLPSYFDALCLLKTKILNSRFPIHFCANLGESIAYFLGGLDLDRFGYFP